MGPLPDEAVSPLEYCCICARSIPAWPTSSETSLCVFTTTSAAPNLCITRVSQINPCSCHPTPNKLSLATNSCRFPYCVILDLWKRIRAKKRGGGGLSNPDCTLKLQLVSGMFRYVLILAVCTVCVSSFRASSYRIRGSSALTMVLQCPVSLDVSLHLFSALYATPDA